MKSLKLFLIVSAFCVFILSCGQSPETKNIALGSAQANTAANSSVSNDPPSEKRPDSAAANLPEDDSADLYATNCMICHKDTGKGGKVSREGKTFKSADLTSEKIRSLSDEKLLSVIKNGEPDEGMPAFKGKLSDEEIKSIIGRIRKF